MTGTFSVSDLEQQGSNPAAHGGVSIASLDPRISDLNDTWEWDGSRWRKAG